MIPTVTVNSTYESYKTIANLQQGLVKPASNSVHREHQEIMLPFGNINLKNKEVRVTRKSPPMKEE
jgi:hypothetical protein